MQRRAQIDNEAFEVYYLHKIMRSLFPKRNDYALMEELKEVVSELNTFGIKTKKEVRLFVKKYRRYILNGEKESLDAFHRNYFCEMYGSPEYDDCIRRQYWYAYPGMIRVIMEIEFGEEYEHFSNQRDGI